MKQYHNSIFLQPIIKPFSLPLLLLFFAYNYLALKIFDVICSIDLIPLARPKKYSFILWVVWSFVLAFQQNLAQPKYTRILSPKKLIFVTPRPKYRLFT